MKRKILVIGAGAIGGIVAARLSQKNIDVDLLVKYPDLKEIAKNDGLKVKGHHGSFKKKVNTYLPSDLLSETFSIVMIATKANDMKEAAMQILPFLEKDSLVVSLQNGICEDQLSNIVGEHRTVGCIIGWGATMICPGKYDMTSGGMNVIGSFNGVPEDKLHELRNILSNIAPTYISSNIYGDLYAKLIINSCISALGAISERTVGQMLRRKKFRNMFLQIANEALDVAEAMGLKIEPYANKIDYYKFLKPGTFSTFRQHAAMTIFGMKYRRLKSSSLQSIERGKKTEIDYLNGYIVRMGEKFNIDTPLNRKVVEMIKEIESGNRDTGMHNLDDPFFENY